MIAPTFIATASVIDALPLSNIQVATQDAHWENEGAYTSNISPASLKELGVKYVILGHSERRQYDNETDARVNNKLKNVLKNGLKAIVCVGETLQERESGKTEKVIDNQLKGCFESSGRADLANIVSADEPVWAIGTGKNATP